MPPTPLTPAVQTTLALADPTAIRTFLNKFASAGAPTWIDPAASHPDGRFPRNQDFSILPPAEVIETIAVRGPLHCIDGWGYLARAISALSVGDGHGSRHLAYYAELRAALSILATQGIANFDKKNVVVDKFGGIHLVLPDRSTHEVSWLALEHWAGRPGSLQSIASCLDINGVSLFDALAAFFPAPAAPLLGTKLIQSWGFDLSQSYIDREQRNDSSYQPNDLVQLNTVPTEDLDFIEKLWRALEPGTFQIERFLFRKMLESQAENLYGSPSLAGRSIEYSRLDARIQAFVSLNFLERTVEPEDHEVLVKAAQSVAPASPYEMLSRAILLLRLATGLVEVNFKEALVNPYADLQFWWNSFGGDRGFWTAGAPPDEMSLLWTDVEDALDEARGAAQSDRFGWLSNLPLGLPRVCETERIGLWTLCR